MREEYSAPAGTRSFEMIEEFPRPVSADARDAAVTFGAIIVSNAFTYAFYVVVSRGLGVDSGGAVLAFSAATLLVAAPATVIGTVLAGELARSRGAALGAAALGVERLALAIFGVAIVVFALATPLVASFFHVSTLVAAAAGPAFASSLALPFARAGLQGGHAFGSFAVSLIVEGAGKFVAGVAALLGMATLAGTVAGYSLAQLLALAAASLLVRGRFPAVRPARLRARPPSRSIVALGALAVMTFADSAIARHVLDPRASALFNVASLVGRALVTIVSFIPPVLVPIAAAATPARRRSLLGGALLAIAAMAAGPAVLVAAAPQHIATLIGGNAYAAAAPLVRAYVVAAVGLAFAVAIASYGVATGARRLAFPLAAIAIAELTGYGFYHGSAADLIAVTTVGHIAAAATTAIVLFVESSRLPMPANRARDRFVEADPRDDAELGSNPLA